MSTINFDATTVAPQQPLEAIPSGWYKAAVSESAMEPTSDGSGIRLKYELAILEGPFKGRKVFDGFNLQNKNPQAVEIAQQQLSALCHATGVLRVTDSTQLHNIPVLVKVSLDGKRTVDVANNEINPTTKQPYVEGAPGTKTYEAQNRVKGFKNVNDGAPAGAAPVVAAGAPPVNPTWATAKPATPAPAVAPTPAAAPASNALPPWEQNKTAPAVPAAAPAAVSPAAPATPKGPKGPKKPAAPAAAPERKFFVYFADDKMPLMTESEIVANIAKGMPAETPILLEQDMEGGDWKDAAQYNIGAAPVAAAPVNGTGVAPWERTA